MTGWLRKELLTELDYLWGLRLFFFSLQVGRVGEATMALGRLAAPHLERSANRC